MCAGTPASFSVVGLLVLFVSKAAGFEIDGKLDFPPEAIPSEDPESKLLTRLVPEPCAVTHCVGSSAALISPGQPQPTTPLQASFCDSEGRCYIVNEPPYNATDADLELSRPVPTVPVVRGTSVTRVNPPAPTVVIARGKPLGPTVVAVRGKPVVPAVVVVWGKPIYPTVGVVRGKPILPTAGVVRGKPIVPTVITVWRKPTAPAVPIATNCFSKPRSNHPTFVFARRPRPTTTTWIYPSVYVPDNNHLYPGAGHHGYRAPEHRSHSTPGYSSHPGQYPFTYGMQTSRPVQRPSAGSNLGWTYLSRQPSRRVEGARPVRPLKGGVGVDVMSAHPRTVQNIDGKLGFATADEDKAVDGTRLEIKVDGMLGVID